MGNLATAYDIGHKQLEGGAPVDVKIAAVKVYRGRAAGLIASTGYARPLLYNDTTYRFIGVFGGTVDNSGGSAGDLSGRVYTRGLFLFTASPAFTQADVKKTVWFQDDNTVSVTQGSSVIPAGVLETIDADGGWIRIQPYGTREALSSTDYGVGPVLSDVFASSTASTALSLNQTGATDVILGTTSVTGVRLFADQPINDSAGNELIKFTKTTTAVAEITIKNNSTGANPVITSTGETNTGLDISTSGTGTLTFWSGGKTRSNLAIVNVASSVNQLTITPAIAGGAPSLTATGTDTNIGLIIGAKAAGAVMFSQMLVDFNTVTTVSATGATTITAAQLLGGLIVYSGNGAATFTFPTGTQITTALPGSVAGNCFDCTFKNTGNNTLTVAAGASGMTMFAGDTLTQVTVTVRTWRFVCTSANNWTVYSINGPDLS
jgi:hypothetical protein